MHCRCSAPVQPVCWHCQAFWPMKMVMMWHLSHIHRSKLPPALITADDTYLNWQYTCEHSLFRQWHLIYNTNCCIHPDQRCCLPSYLSTLLYGCQSWILHTNITSLSSSSNRWYQVAGQALNAEVICWNQQCSRSDPRVTVWDVCQSESHNYHSVAR